MDVKEMQYLVEAVFEKRAAKKEKVHSLGFMDSQRAMNKAMRAGDSGIGQFLAKNEVVGGRIKHGLAGAGIGAAGGGGLGALAGLLAAGKSIKPGTAALAGAAIGAGVGSLLGQSIGGYKHDVNYLRKKGLNPRWLGLFADATPAAKKKYLEAG